MSDVHLEGSTCDERATNQSPNFPSVPCPPTNIAALHACSPDPTPVSWVASSSASHYTAVAESSTGHTSECTTNQTSCSLSGLRCGDVYTVAVAGVDHTCTGPPSDPVSLHTGDPS